MPFDFHAPQPLTTMFFTVNLAQRGSDLLTREIETLRAVFHRTWLKHPWEFDAIVVLPDRLHAVVSLPLNDMDYATRWRVIKGQFSRHLPRQPRRLARSVWQRGYQQHKISSRADYWAHVRYCWQAPVETGLVEKVVDWEYSSFQRDVRMGRVRSDWG